MRYRIRFDDPRVRNENFIEFRRTDLGKESVHTEPDPHATWMALDVARIALRRLRETQYRLRCCLLDEYGAVVDGYNNTQPKQRVDIFTSHENLVWRDQVNGMTIELPIVKNAAYDPPRFYFRFASGPDLSVVDRSIQGSSPAECFERFVGNPHFAHLIERYKIDAALPAPEPPKPVAPPVQIQLPPGYQLAEVSLRPGSFGR